MSRDAEYAAITQQNVSRRINDLFAAQEELRDFLADWPHPEHFNTDLLRECFNVWQENLDAIHYRIDAIGRTQ